MTHILFPDFAFLEEVVMVSVCCLGGNLSIFEDVEKLSKQKSLGLAGEDAKTLKAGNYISQAPCGWGL